MSWELLIVEDDQTMAALLANLAKKTGFNPVIAADISSANRLLSQSVPDVLFTDHRLPDGEGIDFLEDANARFPELPSVMITGYATVPTVIRAFRAGALDLISKPFDNNEIRRILIKVRETLARQRRIEALTQHFQMADGHTTQLVSSSSAMKNALNLASRVSDLETPVLLTGETGTGKSLLAQWIHSSSNEQKPWLSINCGAVAESVAESELFGYERGAFTGASQRKQGLLELAEGGTLFLDEINSASMAIQTRLLEFVQYGQLQRLGGNKTIKVNVRLIAASNQNLEELVKAGSFREDLFYRLNVFPIPLPALRERIDDIPMLVERFIACYARKTGRLVQGISDEALLILKSHHWPGNIRELENVIHRAVVLTENTLIEVHHLPIELQQLNKKISPEDSNYPWSPDAPLQIVEGYWIQHMLTRSGGNKTEAARRLGIDTSTLHRKLKQSSK